MKKFRIELDIESHQKVYYDIEAENREELDKMLETGCPEDYGQCSFEESPYEYDEKITDIEEVKNESL